MFFALVFSSICVKRDKYVQCANSKFCTRDREVDTQKWSIKKDSIKTSQNSFLAVIDDSTFHNDLLLKIHFHGKETIRVRIEPSEKESFNRFDTSLEPTIIDPNFINQKRDFEITQTDNNCQLKSGNQILSIQYSPFLISLQDEKGESVVLNFNDTAIFETRRNKDQNPELFDKNNFNGFEDNFKNGPTSVAMSIRFSGSDLRLSGLPSHTYPLSLPDTVGSTDPIRFYNTDINEFEVGNGMAMYGAVPLVYAHSNDRVVGLFWCNPSETWVDIKSAEDKSYANTRFMSEGGYIDVYIFTGKPKDIANEYTQLTGRPMLISRFAMAFHQCRWGYMTQEDLVSVSKKLDEFGVPHDVLWLDLDYTVDRKYFQWNTGNFPSPKKMLQDFEKSRRYVVTVNDPHLKAEKSYSIYNQALSKKLLMTQKGGGVYEAHCWPGRSAWPDFMNPATREWWEKLFDFANYPESHPNLYMWNDMNEISVFDSSDNTCPRDLVHYGDIEEREVHNIYGHLMVSATWGGLRKRTDEPLRPFILTRSFFPGSQKYAAVWSGDNAAEWAHLKSSIPLVLSYGISGIVYSGSDVGGFFNSPNDELLSRWFTIGAWTYSFFREHCHHLAARREIYLIGSKAAQDLAKESVVERYMMLPYWYTLAKETNETGNPIVRPLWWEYDNKELRDVDDQVLLGSALLVIPFVEEGTKDRTFVLPPGTWYNFRTLQDNKGNTHAKYDNGKTLVLQKAGSIVPMKCRIRKSSEFMLYDPFTLVVVADENGNAEGRLYEDDGKTERFEKGNFVDRLFTLRKDSSNYILSNKPFKEYVESEFSKDYDVTVERIRVAGLPKPASISSANGEIEFSYEDNVLTIRKPDLLVRDNWEITIKY